MARGPTPRPPQLAPGQGSVAARRSWGSCSPLPLVPPELRSPPSSRHTMCPLWSKFPHMCPSQDPVPRDSPLLCPSPSWPPRSPCHRAAISLSSSFPPQGLGPCCFLGQGHYQLFPGPPLLSVRPRPLAQPALPALAHSRGGSTLLPCLLFHGARPPCSPAILSTQPSPSPLGSEGCGKPLRWPAGPGSASPQKAWCYMPSPGEAKDSPFRTSVSSLPPPSSSCVPACACVQWSPLPADPRRAFSLFLWGAHPGWISPEGQVGMNGQPTLPEPSEGPPAPGACINRFVQSQITP